MLTQSQEKEILTLLRTLPKDKVDEVKDFALFLKSKYQPIDYSTEWTEEDLRDFSNASLNYFDEQE